MAAGDHGGPGPDLYQLLGVPREASREEIAQAWRRRARAEHPDHRPRDAGDAAADWFRVLAGAWRVLSDPARRAAYDPPWSTSSPPRGSRRRRSGYRRGARPARAGWAPRPARAGWAP